MIYEIAITPQALEELLLGKDSDINTERLANLLFPGDAKHGNVLIADLATDEWARSIKAIREKLPPDKKLAGTAIFKRVFDLIEPHDRYGQILDSESHWIQEAHAGNNVSLIDFVFAKEKDAKFDKVEKISRLSDKKWTQKTFHSVGPAYLTEQEQEVVFEKFFQFSDWCYVELPYLSSSLSNESRTALQLVKIACRSGKLRRTPFHIDLRCRPDSYCDFEGAKLPTAIEQIIGDSSCNRAVTVDIFTNFRKKNQTLYVGTISQPGAKNASCFRRVKWRVVMPHVRIGSNDDDTLDADWTLSDLSVATDRFRRLSAEMQSGGPPAISLGKKSFELKW